MTDILLILPLIVMTIVARSSPAGETKTAAERNYNGKNDKKLFHIHLLHRKIAWILAWVGLLPHIDTGTNVFKSTDRTAYFHYCSAGRRI
jgi:hypothetical protein